MHACSHRDFVAIMYTSCSRLRLGLLMVYGCQSAIVKLRSHSYISRYHCNQRQLCNPKSYKITVRVRFHGHAVPTLF